jgi:hypothetical protein
LSHADRVTTMAMAMALPMVSAGLRMFGYVRMRRWIEQGTRKALTRSAQPSDIAEGKRLVRLAAIAGKHGPVEATCLRQALLVYALLRKRNLTPELVLGVNRQQDEFGAHAWVALSGTSLDAGENANLRLN